MKFQIQFLLIIFTLFLASFSPSTAATAGKTKSSNVVADTVAKRERLLATYMSVSYPLATIHITSPYGYRADPFTGKRTLHNGIDLRASNRSEVYAMLAGRVVSVGHDRASGIYLTIQSGSYLITYCHLSCTLIRPGSSVAPGSLVALSGNTGTRSTGPHLHISVKHTPSSNSHSGSSPNSRASDTAHYINPAILLDYIRSTRAAAIASILALDHAAP